MEETATAPGDYLSLYRQAFARYGVRALWNKRLIDDPTPEDALVVARALRIDREARRLAEQIEQACRQQDSAARSWPIAGLSNTWGAASWPLAWQRRNHRCHV